MRVVIALRDANKHVGPWVDVRYHGYGEPLAFCLDEWRFEVNTPPPETIVRGNRNRSLDQCAAGSPIGLVKADANSSSAAFGVTMVEQKVDPPNRGCGHTQFLNHGLLMA